MTINILKNLIFFIKMINQSKQSIIDAYIFNLFRASFLTVHRDQSNFNRDEQEQLVEHKIDFSIKINHYIFNIF